MEDESKKIVWLKNKHGVKFTRTKEQAEKLMATSLDYRYTEPDVIPKEKRYVMDTGLTQKGASRRNVLIMEPIQTDEEDIGDPTGNKEALIKSVDEEAEPLMGDDMKTLRAKAKEAGINSFGKSKEKLIELLGQ